MTRSTSLCSLHPTATVQLIPYIYPAFVPFGRYFTSIPLYLGIRGCSGSQKLGARKIARCHFQVPVLKVRSQFRSQLTLLQGANFFEPKQWMIACTTTSLMFSFMYKWSGFVCTNVCLYCTSVFHFDCIIKNKNIYIIYYNMLYFTDYQGFSQDFETISHFCGTDF